MKLIKRWFCVGFFWLLWPALRVYLHGSHRSRVLIIRGTEALLIRDHSKIYFDTDRWTIPGGGVQRHETPAQAAARELAEELSMQVDPADLQFLGTRRTGSYGLRYTGHFFVLRVSGDVSYVQRSREVAEVRWLPLAGLNAGTAKTEARHALDLLHQTSA